MCRNYNNFQMELRDYDKARISRAGMARWSVIKVFPILKIGYVSQ